MTVLVRYVNINMFVCLQSALRTLKSLLTSNSRNLINFVNFQILLTSLIPRFPFIDNHEGVCA